VVPESYLTNPYCQVESPWQTSYRLLATYVIPRIDVLVSSVYSDRYNVGGATDQVSSLVATYTLTAADQASLATQIGRPLTPVLPSFNINLLEPGQEYGPRVRTLDLSLKKILRLGGQRLTFGVDMYNLANSNHTLAFNPTFVPNTPGWMAPTTYLNPRVFRLNAEWAF
jgi:hypothetical protein